MLRNALLIALLSAVAGAAAAQGWEEQFGQDVLDARWTWRAPVDGPTYSLQERPGWLRVRIPRRENGFNHWNQPAPVDEAPQLRAPVPPGDWELEARFELGEIEREANLHVGLMVGASNAQLLVWGPFYGPGLSGGQEAPEVWLEPTGTTGHAKVRVAVRNVTLRLTKIGLTYLAALRQGDADWVEGGAYAFRQPPQFLGLIGKTFISGAPVTFDVEYVRLIPREAPAAEPAGGGTAVEGAASPAPVQRTAPDETLAAAPRPLKSMPARGGMVPADTGRVSVAPQMIALGGRLCDEGDRHVAEGRYADAEACYRVVLLFLPESPRARAGLAKIRAAGH